METFKYLKTANILYVEDEQSVREGYIRTLNRCAKELFVAQNGEEGVEIFEKNQNAIDIIITDIKMPKLNGIEMVKQIQAIQPEIPIIFTSAHSDSSYLFEALDVQAEGYLLKPVPVKKLMYIIDRISKSIYMEALNRQNEVVIHQMEKMTAIGEMIGNIAHQWRQPLSVISSAASGLKLTLELDHEVTKDEMVHTLDYIVNETQMLSCIIDDFRNFFKGEETRKSTFDFTEIKEALEHFLTNNSNDNISVIMDIDEELTFSGNKNLLIQVFINIINNALFALSENRFEKKLLYITIKKEDEKIKISIKDSAGGMSDEIKEKVFEPYFTTKHKSIGTGLGLFMAYQIITMQFKGEISVENVCYSHEDSECKGAEFTIYIA